MFHKRYDYEYVEEDAKDEWGNFIFLILSTHYHVVMLGINILKETLNTTSYSSISLGENHQFFFSKKASILVLYGGELTQMTEKIRIVWFTFALSDPGDGQHPVDSAGMIDYGCASICPFERISSRLPVGKRNRNTCLYCS